MKSKRCRWFCEWNYRIQYRFLSYCWPFNVISSNQPFSWCYGRWFCCSITWCIRILNFARFWAHFQKCVEIYRKNAAFMHRKHKWMKETISILRYFHSLNSMKNPEAEKMDIFFVLVRSVISLCIIYKMNPESMNGSMSCYHVIHGFI